MTKQHFFLIFFAGIILYGVTIFNVIRMFRNLSCENGEQGVPDSKRIMEYIKSYPDFRLSYMVMMGVGIALAVFTICHFS